MRVWKSIASISASPAHGEGRQLRKLGLLCAVEINSTSIQWLPPGAQQLLVSASPLNSPTSARLQARVLLNRYEALCFSCHHAYHFARFIIAVCPLRNTRSPPTYLERRNLRWESGLHLHWLRYLEKYSVISLLLTFSQIGEHVALRMVCWTIIFNLNCIDHS